jgi:hypothetical protein
MKFACIGENEQTNHSSPEAGLKKPRSVSEMVLRASATLVISKLNPLWRVCADEIGSVQRHWRGLARRIRFESLDQTSWSSVISNDARYSISVGRRSLPILCTGKRISIRLCCYIFRLPHRREEIAYSSGSYVRDPHELTAKVAIRELSLLETGRTCGGHWARREREQRQSCDHRFHFRPP